MRELESYVDGQRTDIPVWASVAVFPQGKITFEWYDTYDNLHTRTYYEYDMEGKHFDTLRPVVRLVTTKYSHSDGMIKRSQNTP